LVEELGPELQLHRFANREVLEQGEVRNGLMVWTKRYFTGTLTKSDPVSFRPYVGRNAPCAPLNTIPHGLSTVREHQGVIEDHREWSDMVDGSQLDRFLGHSMA
jgi:hypothetical protein